jgi:hypothetical protein
VSFLDDLSDRWTPEPNTGCYLWSGGTNGRGYAQANSKLIGRIILEEAVGPPPTSKHQAAHDTPNGCCGPACINPSHLRWATVRENKMDMPAKARSEMVRWAQASLTAEQRTERASKASAFLTKEERSNQQRALMASRTPEERSEIVRKGHATRRARP